MEKAFGKSETNAEFFYELLHGDSSGSVPDEKIDGAVPDPMADAKAFPVTLTNNPDKLLQGPEVVAAAFNRITSYYPKITEHFQALGLDLAGMIGPDGSVKADFVAKVTARLEGKDPSAPKQSLSYQAAQVYISEKYQLSIRDTDFADKWEAFQKLPQADRDAELKKFFADPKQVGVLLRSAFRHSEFSLLPFKDQVEVFKRAGYDEALVKAELGSLWQGRGLPKWVAQAALLKGLEMEEEARALTGDAAQKKSQEARMLFRAAVELDNQNPLARRRLATYLLREGKIESASFHLGEAAKSETELRYLVEIVQGLEKGDKRLVAGHTDAWAFVADNLVLAKRYGDAAALYHEAAKAATGRGDNDASIAFTEKELRTDEAGKPFVLSFTEDSNPIALALYKALNAQGVPSALIDGQGDGEVTDRKLSPTEIFNYLDGHWKEDRVQKALRSLNFPLLSWEQPDAKLPYADDAFEKMTFPQKMSAWHRYEAAQALAKQPLDAAVVAKHLGIAALYEPKIPERHRALGDFLLQQKNYKSAVAAYQAADQAAGFADPAIKTSLGHAFFGLGEFKNSRDMYTAALEKTPKDVALLKLRQEADQLYLAQLDPIKDADAATAVQAELNADGAYLLAMDATAEKAKLDEMAKVLEGLHDGDADKARTVAALAGLKPDEMGGISKQDAIAAVEGLAGNYLALAEQSYPDPKDTEKVRSELNGLAVQCFRMLKSYAEKDGDPEVKRMAGIYEASALFAEGKIDEAAELLKPLRKLPQADRILKAIENGKARLVNASAMEAWQVYNQDMERSETDSAKGWASRTSVASVTEKWRKEKAITAAVKEKIVNGEATTIEEALKLLSVSGTDELKERAKYYLSTECRANGTGPIGDLISYAAGRPPSASDASIIMQKAFDAEATKGAVESSFAFYSILYAASPEDDVKKKAQTGMDALQGKAGFGRSVEKFFKMHSGEGLAVDVGLMFLAAGLGNLAKLRMLAKLEQVGVNGYRAVILANAVGIGTEATALWGANTVKDAMFTDPSKVFSSEHLLKSYGSTLLMIGGLKGFGKLAEGLGPRAAKSLGLVTESGTALTKGGKVLVWGFGQAGGLGGMIATSKANQAFGLTPKPVGGWKEGMVNDVFGYLQFAVAHKVADTVVKGKMTEVAQMQHTGIAFKEALLVARGQVDSLGFKAEKFEIKVGKEGAVTANDKALEDYPAELKKAIETSLQKGKGDKVENQTVFLESPDRQLLVGLFVEASLNRPGFAGGKLAKFLETKDYAKANAYLKEFKLPLHFAADGKLVAAAAEQSSAHQDLGITPPAADAELASGAKPAKDGKGTTPKAPDPHHDGIPLADENDVVLLEDGMTSEPQKKLAARKTPPKLGPAREVPVEPSDVKPVAVKSPIPEALRRGLAVDASGKPLSVDFNESGIAFLGKSGVMPAPVGGSKVPHAEIAMTLDQGKPVFQVRAVGSEKLQTVDEQGQVYDVTATYRPLHDGDRIRIGGTEYTWFGPVVRQGLSLQTKVLTVFAGKVYVEDVTAVQGRGEWARDFVTEWEKQYVGQSSLFGDPANNFAERVKKDPRLSDPEFRRSFIQRSMETMNVLRPILEKAPEEKRSELAYSFMKQVLEGKLTLGDATGFAASVESKNLVFQAIEPFSGKTYNYLMVPAFDGTVLPKNGALLKGGDASTPLDFKTVYVQQRIGEAALQFNQGMARNGADHNYYVQNRSEGVPFAVFDGASGTFLPMEAKQNVKIVDGSVLRVGDRKFIFHSPEAMQREIVARNEILAEREVLTQKRGEVLSLSDGTPEKVRELARLAKLEQDFRDKLKAQGRDSDGVSTLQKEMEHLALTDTEFAKAARRALVGEISPEQYREAQTELGRKLVGEHRAALEDVRAFLGKMESSPILGHRLAELSDGSGRKLENPHSRLKDPADIAAKLSRRAWTDLAPLTDVAGARVVVRTTNDALPIVEAIEAHYKVRPQMGADGTMELDIIGQDRNGNGDGDVLHVTSIPDKDHPDRLTVGSSSGYRALHVVVDIDGKPVEIQIQTEAIYLWGKIQHSLIYKNKGLPKETFDELNAFCRDAAKYLTRLESGPAPGERPTLPLIPKSLKQEMRGALSADLKKMSDLMDRFEASAQDPSLHNTKVFKRPPTLPSEPAGEKASSNDAEGNFSEEAKTGVHTPSAKGKGRLPSRRALPEDVGQANAAPELRVDPAAKPVGQGFEIPLLRSSDGHVFRLPLDRNPVTLGSKEGNADILLKHSRKGSAPLHAEILRSSDGSYHLRPLAGQAVFVWENNAWRKLDATGRGESHLLRPGDRIKMGDWEFHWNLVKPPALPPRSPKPPPLPGKQAQGPTYRQVSERGQNVTREITQIVDTCDAFASGEDKEWSSSYANIYTPDQSHLPIRSSWYHLSEGDYDKARADGNLKDTPASTYEVRVYGEQRKADMEARLKEKYGPRLERLESLYEGVSEWVIRNEAGEAQVGIKITSKELKIPSAAEARAVYSKFAKDQLPRILEWAGQETSMRNLYAFRMLTMIGVEGDGQGGRRIGTRVEAAIERMERAPTSSERARAGEELATLVAYLQDAPLLVLEHRILSSALGLRDGPEVTWGIAYALKQKGEILERGNSAYQASFDLRRSAERLRSLGEELRKAVPIDQQKKGNPVFDDYVAALQEVKGHVQTLVDFLQFLKAKGIDVKKLAPKFKTPMTPAAAEVDDDMIVEIKAVAGEKSDRDLHGAEDRPTHDLRQFDESELENLSELGVSDLDGLRNYGAPNFSNNLVNALDYLLNHHLKSREYESGVVRLVGALRHWEMYSGQKISWLNGYLHKFGRSPYGIPLESVPPPVPPPFRVPLSQEEQRSLGFREINPGNLMKIIAAIRARSTPLEKIGDFMPFLPNEEDRRVLTKIMGNYSLFVHQANPKLGAYLEAMFKPGEAYAAALELKDPEDGEDKLPERRPESAAALVAVPTPRLGDPTGAYVEEISTQGPLGKELKSLARPRPTFVSEVPGLTPALEKIFDRGGRVEKWPSGMMLVESPSGAETRIARPASPTEIVSYLRWYQRQGFANADGSQTVLAWKQLEKRAQEMKIQLVLGEDVAEGKPEGERLERFLKDNSGQVVFLNSLLQLLPASALGGGHLNRIHLKTPRQENAHFGAYDASDGSLYLYSGGFEGSRRNLAALFLHELGHPNALRYHTDAKGDSMIPLSVRSKMLASQQTLAKLGALYAIDWGEGYEARRGKQAADFDEFLADLQVAYVAAGPSLRAHIRGFREGTPEREAWDFVYSELRDRIFGGLEYDFVTPPPSPKPGLKVLPGGKSKAAPPVPVPTLDGFLRSDIGPQNAVKVLRLGGLSAGRDPGVGRYANNEDRFAVVRFTDKQGKKVTRYFAIDGMGGHEGGEFAASFSQYVLQQAAKNPHLSLEAAMQLADREMKKHPEYRRIAAGAEAGENGHQKPGAVVVGVEVKERADGQYEVQFADVGDSEAMVFDSNFQVQEGAYTAKEPRSSKKLARGQTIVTRIDPFAHMVDQALGGHYREGKNSLEVAVETHGAKRGSVVVAGTDGLLENFASKDEIGEVLRSSGAKNSAEMELALRNEALIRMHLFQAFREQKRTGEAITHADYVAAYQKVWKQAPPPGTWRYEGMILERQGHVVDPSKTLHRDGINAYYVGHFKLDNLTVVVQVLDEELGAKGAFPRPDFLPPPLPPLTTPEQPAVAAQVGSH